MPYPTASGPHVASYSCKFRIDAIVFKVLADEMEERLIRAESFHANISVANEFFGVTEYQETIVTVPG